ncbi:unnamed protein product [Periconia digitata]|uniref:Heterokaryon incompatibility domain-containing protein n=1 Tax=Periconia digitata TaxID=1303443 RepID=A0A9W4UMH8_9PLEO|nr:unnamed protein product [Periconia digitata]
MNSVELYSTLPSAHSIRLLNLHPGTYGKQITCSLIVIDDYTSAPEHKALSYHWGNANDTTELTCNGNPIFITKNLYAALHRIRGETQPCLIWADAICINQKDVEEKNQQLTIMPDIYHRASSVIVWVGHGDENTHIALDMIKSIGYACCREIYGSSVPQESYLPTLRKEPERTQLAMRTNLASLEEISYTIPSWKMLWRFFQSEWFFRVWVIQEVRDCADVWLLCGEEKIEWDLVALAANWVLHSADRDDMIEWRKEYYPSYHGFRNAFLMWDRSWSTRRDAPFLAFLRRVRSFRSTDPRDKIFAVLHHHIIQAKSIGSIEDARVTHSSDPSIHSSATHLGFEADYSMTTYEVYRKIALDSVRYYQNLEILCYAWPTANLDTSYPSWVPRWDLPTASGGMLLPFLYNASPGTVPWLRHSFEPDNLTLRGLCVGTVVDITGFLKFDDKQGLTNNADCDDSVRASLIEVSRILLQDKWQEESDRDEENTAQRAIDNPRAHFADFCAYLLPLLEGHAQDSYITFDSWWCNLCSEYIIKQRQAVPKLPRMYHCRICDDDDFDLCSNCYDSGKWCKDSRHRLKSVKPVHLWCPYNAQVIQQLRVHASTGNADRFGSQSKFACVSRVFFTASRGWKGTGSRHIEPGDFLVVLFGSRVPFILRKYGTGYRLISDCYIYGLMDGEAMRMYDDGELELEDFVIQ